MRASAAGPLVFCGALALAGGLAVPPARAQVSAAAFRGGVPAGEATPAELALTLSDAIERGLSHNLGLILGREDVRAAQGARRGALADLLPQLRAGVT